MKKLLLVLVMMFVTVSVALAALNTTGKSQFHVMHRHR